MIRTLRKRHRRTFLVLGIVLVLVLLEAIGLRPGWPQEEAAAPRQSTEEAG
jgi:hypothetical protein